MEAINNQSFRWVLSLIFILGFGSQSARAHNDEDVHHRLMSEAIDVASSYLDIQFSTDDQDDLEAGAEHEDDGDWWGDNPRYRHHGYNPHTGSPFDPPAWPDVVTALERATWTLSWTNYQFYEGIRNGYWEVDFGLGGPWHEGGGFHFLGRTSHLLQDMTSPPHVHAPDGHGSFYSGYYSDFEDYWKTENNFHLFPPISGSPLFPSDGIPISQSWGSKLDDYSWSRMRARVGSQTNNIDGFIDTVAWTTYFHSSFYGEVQDSTTDAAPATTTQNDVDGLGMGQPNVLYRMFNELGELGSDRLQYSGGLLVDDYWVIDGIGWYDKFDLTFNDWWPCDDDSVGSVFAGKITGRFYIYQTWGTADWGGLSCYPDAWPNGETNSSNKVFAKYYGEFLFPISARYNAGLLQEALLPSVDAFDVIPESVTVGDSFGISYTVSDTGGSGLNRVELWRANDSGGSPVDWIEIKRTPLSGNGPYNGSFSDAPSLAGSYWYGVHAVNNAGFWSVEPDPPGPIKVTVTPLSPPAPPAPTQVSPSNGEIGVSLTPTFKWNSVPGADYYGLYVSEPPYGESHLVFDSTEDYGPIYGTSFTLPSGRLSYGVTYRWNMNSHNSAGWGSYSKPSWSFTTTSPTVQYSITASAGPNGLIVPSGDIVKNAGDDQQFTASSNTGYSVDQWYLDGSSVQSGGNSYTLTNIQSDHTVYVTFIGTVATPTFSPDGGSYSSPVDVTISCATPGATIHYTTNGADPTESDPVYSSPIHISSMTTLKAKAWKPDWNPSEVAADTYVIRLPMDIYVDDDAPNDPGPGDPIVSDPLEDGTADHPFDAIQEAIDIAYDGDIIIVLDGIYTGVGNRDIDFNGKAIALRSENGPDNCIIDCQGTENEPHRGFYFHSSEEKNSIVDGFMITNGYGPMELFPALPDPKSIGGAIFCKNSNPTISNCYIAGNLADSGGGIFCLDSSPKIDHCLIRNNSVIHDGGGIYCHSGRAIINDCIIKGNHAHSGGGIYSFGYFQDSEPTISNCIISENDAYQGAGICSWYRSKPLIINSIIWRNWTWVGGKGGGLFSIYSSTHPKLINCSIVSNSADAGGGIHCTYYSSVTIENSILWDNAANNGPEIALSSGPSSVTISYSDIQGGKLGVYAETNCILNWGSGNINVDPSFVDADNDNFHLLAGSQCIDAGNNNALPPDTADLDGDGNTTEPIPWDLDGNPRIIGDEVDMSAYEFQGNGIVGDFCGAGSDQPDGYVDYWDLLYFAQRWHSSPSDTNWDPRCDLDKEDNYVDYWDLLVFAQQWHKGQKP